MTRKELRERAEHDAQCRTADRDLQVAFADIYRVGARWGYDQAIEKAVEWLDCYIDNYLFVDLEDVAGIRWDDFVNDFKEAMKGG